MNSSFIRALVALFIGAVLLVAVNYFIVHLFHVYLFSSFLVSWLICSAVVWFVMRSKLPPIANSPTTHDKGRDPLVISTEGSWTVIDAQPAKPPKELAVRGWLIGAIAAPFVAYVLMAITGFPNSESGGFTEWVLLGAVVWAIIGTLLTRWFKSMTAKPRRIQPAPFAVGSEGVRLPNGNIISADQIYALTIRNGSNQVIGTTPRIFVGGFGAAGAIAVASASMHAGIQHANIVLRSKMADIAFTVEVEHAGKSTVLA